MKQHVQEKSRKSVEPTYGSGKAFQVEFTMDFPYGKVGPNTFTVQMASLERMPNAVFTFLSMVEQGLWEGCSFMKVANEVMKAVPLSYDDTRSPAKVAHSFRDANLNEHVFREYNDEF